MELRTIGIDLGKTVFHLVRLNLRGAVVVHKKLSRKQLLHFTSNLPVHLIGRKAARFSCSGRLTPRRRKPTSAISRFLRLPWAPICQFLNLADLGNASCHFSWVKRSPCSSTMARCQAWMRYWIRVTGQRR